MDSEREAGSAPTRAEPTRASIQNVGNRIDLFVDGKPHFTVYLDSNSSLYAERFVAAVNVVFNAAEERAEEMRQARNGANLEKIIARGRVAELERDLAQARAESKLYYCPECAFGFAAEHHDEGKPWEYTCPLCAETRLERELSDAREQAKRTEEEIVQINEARLDAEEDMMKLERENAALIADRDHWKITADAHASLVLKAQDIAGSYDDIDMIVRDLVVERDRLREAATSALGLYQEVRHVLGESGIRNMLALEAALAPAEDAKHD